MLVGSMVSTEQIREVVFRAISGVEGKSLRESSNPRVHRLLRPFDGADFPLNRIHDFSRVQRGAQKQWVDKKQITEIIKSLPEAKAARVNSGVSVKEFFRVLPRIVDEAIEYRGYRAYEEEWKSQSETQVREVVNAASGLPKKANELNAEETAKIVKNRLRTQERVAVFDVGTGGGGTIIPMVQKLTPEEKKRIDVFCLDVMQHGLDRAKKALLGRTVEEFVAGKWQKVRYLEKGLKPEQVVTINANFYDIALLQKGRRAPPNYSGTVEKIRPLVGKIDVVISGAAIHHSPNTQPVFSGLHLLLKPNGRIHIFDWGHYARTKREIELHSKGMKQRVPVTKGNAPKKAETVYGMNRAWASLFWTYPKVGEKLERDMRAHEAGKKPFDFQKWIVENRKLIKKLKDAEKYKAAKKSGAIPPCCMEGHEPLPERIRAMRQAGFKVQKAHTPFYDAAQPHGVGSLLYLIKARKIHRR